MSDDRPRAEGREDAFLGPLYEPPPPAFAAALRDRLRQQERAAGPHGRRWPWSPPWPRGPRARVAAPAVGLLLLLSVALAAPVLARTRATLPHSAPYEIAPSTPGGAIVLPPATVVRAPTPTGRRWESLERLEAVVGVPLLTPTYLPPDCPERERFSIPAPVNAAYRTYGCVIITQQAIVRGGTARPEEPRVGAGAVEEATVNGLPAYVIRGAWVVDARGERVWQGGPGLQLVVERDGLIVRLQAGGAGAQTPAELVRIAEALEFPR